MIARFTQFSRRLLAASAIFCCAGMVGTVAAAVNDIFPGDYFPAQPGTTTATLYAYDREQVGPYQQGNKLLEGRIDSSILAMRLAHTVRIGGTTVTGVLALPWVKSEVSPPLLAGLIGKQSDGLSDLRLGVSAWLINDPANAHYLALSGMVIAPTGDYDRRQVLNTGENRWRYIISGGWQKDITPQWLVELSPEIVFHGDNDDYVGNRRLEQRTSYALTGYVRYRASKAWHVFLGGQVNRGGETRINDIDQNNPANNQRWMAGVTWFLPEKQQIILRALEDTDIDNGFRTSREIALRYQKSF